MLRSQTWSNKPLFNTSGGQCPGLFVLQGDWGRCWSAGCDCGTDLSYLEYAWLHLFYLFFFFFYIHVLFIKIIM